MFNRKRFLLAAMVLCASLPITAGAVADGTQPRLKLIAQSGPLFDPFFSALKMGFDDGAKAFGVEVQYVTLAKADNVVGDFTHMLEQTVSAHPAAILVGDFFPQALEPIIKKATDDGAVVVIHNSGLTSWQKIGAIAYVGEDATEMGQAAGAQEVKAGVHHGLCVDQVPGNPVLEQRCTGFGNTLKQNGGTSKMLTIPLADGENPTAVTQAIKGALSADKDIDGIFTLGSAIAIDALKAVDQVGRSGKVTVGTTDLSNGDLEAVRDGKLLFVIDQQPYLQGFDSVQIAVQYIRYGVHPIGPVITGPLLITKANVDDVLQKNKEHRGIRGAM